MKGEIQNNECIYAIYVIKKRVRHRIIFGNREFSLFKLYMKFKFALQQNHFDLFVELYMEASGQRIKRKLIGKQMACAL